MKKILSLALSLIMLLSLTANAVTADDRPQTPIKNVILMIPDGQSAGATTLSRWYKGSNLAIDQYASGLVRTYSADAAIADSAPAATAFATGFKSRTGYIGIKGENNTMPNLPALSQSEKRAPVASVLESARLSGRATGIVATSEIMHATPAAFTAHEYSRKNYDNISEQQVYANLDVVLGGGSKFFTKEVRGDKEDLISAIKENGYNYITTRDELLSAKSGKLWGMFAPSDMLYDMDNISEPTLSEMTQKAIDLLSLDKDGFFLMVEGSKVDWAAHASDPIGIISDTLAFDKACETAIDFAKKDGSTIVIVTTDHGNSGITIGSKNTDSTYDKTPLSSFLEPLKKAVLTGEGIEKKLNADRSNIVSVMAQYMGISDLTNEEISAIKNTKAGSMNYTVGPIMAKRASIGFTTTGHTGEDVPLYVYAPSGRQLTGVVENTDIAKYIANQMALDLENTTKQLFVPLRQSAEAKGAKVVWHSEDSKNPYITITKGSTEIVLYMNKSIALLNQKPISLDGNVLSNSLCTYCPQSVIDLLP